MKSRSTKSWTIAAIATCAILVGCGGGDPVEPPTGPPDLTGTYTLQSFASALLTGGEAWTPPAVSGTFVLQQTSADSVAASGTLSMNIVVPDVTGGSTEINDEGVYAVRTDGTWEQSGSLGQARGTYLLAGATLTVEVTEPAISVSTVVLQRQ